MKMKPFNHVPSAALRLILPDIISLSQVTFKRLSKRADSEKMQQLRTQQRVWTCLQMARLQSANAVQRTWRQYWHGIDPPHVITITRNYQKYQQHGTSMNRNKGNSGEDELLGQIKILSYFADL